MSKYYSDFEIAIAASNLARHLDAISISSHKSKHLVSVALEKIKSGEEPVEKWLFYNGESSNI